MMAAFMCVLAWRQGRTRRVGAASAEVLPFWTRLGVSPDPTRPSAAVWPMTERPLHTITLDLGPTPPEVPAASPALQSAVRTAWSLSRRPDFDAASP